MKRTLLLATFISSLASCDIASAYELRTHAQMAGSAFDYSGVAAQLPNLGLDPTVDIGDSFFTQRGTALAGQASAWDNRFILPRTDAYLPRGWIIRGAVREDDLSAVGCAIAIGANLVHARRPADCNPRDAASPAIDRVLNHFFDPTTYQGLSIGAPAPRWATGLEDPFAGSATDRNTPNDYTLIDARRNMYSALTGTVEGGLVKKEGRNQAWATMFDSLGHAMHVLQDMAQPQHVRVEPHPGSLYEYYIESRAIATQQQDGSASTLVVGGSTYDLLNRYSAYFSSSRSDGSIQLGRGLADYTSRNFFAETSNLANLDNKYQLPSKNPSDYFPVSIVDPRGDGVARMKLMLSKAPETSGLRLSTEDSISASLGAPLYTLNTLNYDDYADNLVPKAVAASAKLVNYFFRGKIGCKFGVSEAGECLIQNYGFEPMVGTFEFFYDSPDGYRYPVPNTRFENRTLQPYDGELPLDGMLVTVKLPPGTPAAVPGEFILVFNGQMGAESTDGYSTNPGAVVGQVVHVHKFLAAGATDHNLEARTNGWARFNGYNYYGESGNGGTFTVPPYGYGGWGDVRINSFTSLTGVVEVSKGLGFSMARKSDGSVWFWGSGVFSFQNDRPLFPRLITGLPPVQSIAGSGSATDGVSAAAAVGRDGKVYTWGPNTWGNRGDGTVTGPFTDWNLVPRQAIGLSNIVKVAGGGQHFLALDSGGRVFSWGSNSSGQLGQGSSDGNPHTVAFQVSGLPRITAISAGGLSSFALAEDGTVYGWGFGPSLGIGATGAIGQPRALPLGDVIAIAAGARHGLALKRDGSVWIWGDNRYGQLGNGAFGSSAATPIQVGGLPAMFEISAGDSHSMAVAKDGAIWGWGRNDSGQLGLGITTTASPYGIASPGIGIYVD